MARNQPDTPPAAGNTTFGMRPQGLAALWRLGMAETPAAPSDEDIRQTLTARLGGSLPPDKPGGGAVRAILGRLAGRSARAGRSIGELLLDSRADLETIRKIKDYGKGLSAARPGTAEHSAGVAIYYAAIASAILFRDAQITRKSFADLTGAMDLLLRKPWITPGLAAHLSKARELCAGKAARQASGGGDAS